MISQKLLELAKRHEYDLALLIKGYNCMFGSFINVVQ